MKEEKVSLLTNLFNEKGVLLPKDVLEAARPESSPLHEDFDWDDGEAAEKYRLWQARQITTTFKVIIEGNEVQQFHNVIVKINNEPVRGYSDIRTILKSEDLTNQLLQASVREIRAWQQKYKELKKAKEMVNEEAISRIEKDLAV